MRCSASPTRPPGLRRWLGALELELGRVDVLIHRRRSGTLAGSLLAGTAAVAQRYGGAWWLWLTFLVLGAFTIVLAILRWLTCLDPARSERGATPPPVGPEEGDQEHLAGTHTRG